MIYRSNRDNWLFHPFFLGEKATGLYFDQDIIWEEEAIENSLRYTLLVNIFYYFIYIQFKTFVK